MRLVLNHTIFKNKLVILIIIFFFLECISKMINFYGINIQFLPQYAKAIIIVFLITDLFYLKNYKLILNIFLLAICLLMSQIYLKFESQNIIHFGKYLLPVLLFDVVNKSVVNDNYLNSIMKIVRKILVFNSILILLGVIFSLELFKTYTGARFGYNGLFWSSAAGSYVYLLTIGALVVNYGSKVITLKSFWLILIAALFIGTKVIYFGISIVIIWLFFNFKYKYITLIFFGGVFILINYFLFYKSQTFNELIYNEGYTTALYSLRDKLLYENTIPYVIENWHTLNYLFGGVQNFDLIRPQMEIVDLLLFWGILGGVIYLIIFSKLFINGIKFTPRMLLIISLLGFSIIFAGNFITYSITAIFAMVFKATLNHKSQQTEKAKTIADNL